MKIKLTYSPFVILLILLSVSALSKDNIVNNFEFYNRNITPPFYLKSIETNPHHITNNNYHSRNLPSEDLITRISEKFFIEYSNNRKIIAEINFIQKNKNYMRQVLTRAIPFFSYIISELKARDMPLELALLPIVESSYDPFAYSIGQAAGLWQMIPITASRFGIEQNWWFDGRRDLIYSTDAALDYLAYLHNYFNDNWLLAIAAYNAGEGSISRAIKKNKAKSLPTDFWNLKLSRQTSAYVPRLLALIEIVKYPKKYNTQIPIIKNDQYFSIIKIDNQIDLALAAELAEMDLNELYLLNAGFNRWATSPDGPYRLLIPNKHVITFSEAYKLLPANQRLRWKRHQVSYGETLSEIAELYNTTAKQIKISNDMDTNIIHANGFLMIPMAHNNLDSYKSTSDQRLITKQNKQRNGERIEHVIERGESLWLIARRYDVKINTLASWNNMSPKDMLSIGDKLVIWTNQPPINNKPIQRKLNYNVKNGDSLYLIAKKFRVSIAGLARWNNLDQQKILKPNQKLIIYIDVTKQSS